MLANRKIVKGMVCALANMRGGAGERRIWCDKTKQDNNERLLAFKFYNSKEADAVATQLIAALSANGYTNKVKRTSVEGDYNAWQSSGEYVRVKVIFE